MDDPYDDLILAMIALAVTAVTLVAGELYLVFGDKAGGTVDFQAAGLDSNIIHPVTW